MNNTVNVLVPMVSLNKTLLTVWHSNNRSRFVTLSVCLLVYLMLVIDEIWDWLFAMFLLVYCQLINFWKTIRETKYITELLTNSKVTFNNKWCMYAEICLDALLKKLRFWRTVYNCFIVIKHMDQITLEFAFFSNCDCLF